MERKLTAILAADVVGFSKLMERDEAGTMARLQANRREVVMPRIASHGGRVVKLMGDGSLVEFASVVSAVACAVEIQTAMATAIDDQPPEQRIQYRIGIHLGDVMIDGDDIYGDGVNIAARLEGVAPHGGIALSASVREHVGGKITLALEDLGEQTLKNIERPVRVYVIRTGDLAGPAPALAIDAAKPEAADGVSLCVLPFTNMSGDAEQEYFSDGISEDIITDLSKVASLLVVSRNTAFSFKGKALNLTQVARQLNVRYVLEGSVRKSGGRVRITAQLIEGASDKHVWAERYDRTLDDIFELQDEISAAIVAALKIKLLPEEKKAIEQRGTASAEAYQILLQARHYRYNGSFPNIRMALRFAERAVEIDPNYAGAWALIAASQIGLHEKTGTGETGLAAAEKALALDPDLAIAHAAKGRVLCGLGRFDEALAAHAQSLHLDPDSFEANYLYGRTCTNLGRAELAIRHFEKAAALAETEYLPLGMVSQSYRALGREQEAMDAARRCMRRIEQVVATRPDDTSALFLGAGVLAELGERERAIEWANRALLMAPEEAMGIYNLACAFSLMGEREKAIEFLERALGGLQPGFVVWMKNDSDLEKIRDHPRYQALVQRSEARLAAPESPPKSR